MANLGLRESGQTTVAYQAAPPPPANTTTAAIMMTSSFPLPFFEGFQPLVRLARHALKKGVNLVL
jgi:hypothetical protein